MARKIRFVPIEGLEGVYATSLKSIVYAFKAGWKQSRYVPPVQRNQYLLKKPVYSEPSKRETSLLTRTPPSVIDRRGV